MKNGSRSSGEPPSDADSGVGYDWSESGPRPLNLAVAIHQLKEEIAQLTVDWGSAIEAPVADAESRARAIQRSIASWSTDRAAWAGGTAPRSAFRDGLASWTERLRSECAALETSIVAPAFTALRGAIDGAQQDFAHAATPTSSVVNTNESSRSCGEVAFAVTRDVRMLEATIEADLEEFGRGAAGHIRGLGRFPPP